MAQNRVDRFIGKLHDEQTFLTIVFTPILLAVVDCVLRLAIRVDLIDVGADMALLGVGLFAALLVNSSSNEKVYVPFLFFIVFLLPWIVCLWTVSDQAPKDTVHLLGYSVVARPIILLISWTVGGVTLIFACILARAILDKVNART